MPPEFSPPAFILYVAGPIELIGGVARDDRPVHELGGVPVQRPDGLRLLDGARRLKARSIFPIVNHGELAVLYCFAFLFISARGAGIWSVDGTRSS